MAAHRYPIRKVKYEALSKKELATAIEMDLEGESTDEEYKEYEKRMKDDRKLNDFLGEDDENDTEFIPSKSSRPDLNDCSDSETSSDAEEGNFDSKKRKRKYQKKPSKVKFLKFAKNSFHPKKNPEFIYCSGSETEERNFDKKKRKKYQSKIVNSKSDSNMNSFHNEISKCNEEKDMFDDDSEMPNIEEISAVSNEASTSQNL